MSSVDDVSLILIALAIDSGVLFFISKASVTLLRNYSDPPNMRCSGCKAAGIDREIWFYGGGREYRSSVGSLSLRRAGVCTVADRNSNRTSYQPGAYSNPQNELYVRESKNGELFVEPDAEISLRLRQQIGLWPGERVHDVPIYSGLLEDICDLFPRIFAVPGALILSSTGRYSRGSCLYARIWETTISKENLGTLRST